MLLTLVTSVFTNFEKRRQFHYTRLLCSSKLVHIYRPKIWLFSLALFSTQPWCCVTFSWIKLQMLLRCCLIHIPYLYYDKFYNYYIIRWYYLCRPTIIFIKFSDFLTFYKIFLHITSETMRDCYLYKHGINEFPNYIRPLVLRRIGNIRKCLIFIEW